MESPGHSGRSLLPYAASFQAFPLAWQMIALNALQAIKYANNVGHRRFINFEMNLISYLIKELTGLSKDF